MRLKVFYLILVCSLLGHSSFLAALANQTTHYKGSARVDGKLVYYEIQSALYNDAGRPLSTSTRYESPDGKLLAEMTTDFKESLSVPSHTIKDFRTGSELGVRWEDGKIVLFHRQKSQEETRQLTDKDADDRVMIAGQGLNFYMHDHLEQMTPGQVVPLRLLIPGKLDYYDFDLEMSSEKPKDGIVEFEIYARNWFFRLLAPKLRAKYDLKSKRIVWYQGISNISDDKGDSQIVTIDFNYY